jgi:hypothetical protein
MTTGHRSVTRQRRIPREAYEFYRRTAEDEAIIRRYIYRYHKKLGDMPYPGTPEGRERWARAHNAVFNDYNEMLKWYFELKDKYDLELLIPMRG